MADRGALVPLGVVGRPHGVRGQVRVHPYNASSTLLGETESLTARLPNGGGSRTLRVLGARDGSKGALVLTLEGVSDVEGATALRGAELCVERAALPPLDDDEWYHVDLVGLAVRRDDGTSVGEVLEVVPYPSVDCIAVTTPEGVREVPAMEPWVLRVDLDAGVVVVGDLTDVPVRAEPKRRA